MKQKALLTLIALLLASLTVLRSADEINACLQTDRALVYCGLFNSNDSNAFAFLP